jgi:ubiquitin-protein ligase
MSESSDRLEKEFVEINQRFADHPQISIVSTDGSPVNQYVIEYRLNGLVQLDSGEVVQSDQHRVELSLSFGFPHFPPNCRPLTRIFHPDMDPSAIKIAEFWAGSTSLVDLIIHIGNMVCWQVYSSDAGFNQAALDWLKDNENSIPMDTIQDGSGGESAGTLPDVDLDLGLSADMPELSLDVSGSSDAADSDTAKDSFVDEIDFNFETSSSEVDLGLDDSETGSEESPLELCLENENIKPVEKEDFAFVAAGDSSSEESAVPGEPDFTPSFPEEESDDVDLDLAVVDVDYDILKGMIDQRNYMAAEKKLSGMVPENKSRALAALQPMVEQRIEQANGVYEQAKKLEEEGSLEEAANKLEAVLNLVQDYPNLDADMKRVRDAWAGSDTPDVSASNMGLERSAASDMEGTQVRDTMLTETGVVSSAGASTVKTLNTQAKKKKDFSSTLKKSTLIAGAGVLVVLCVFAWFFVEWHNYSQANQKWTAMNSLLEKNEYQKVKVECEAIRSHLSHVKIIMGGGKKELLEQVNDLLHSEHFLEGLEGKILWQGEYVSKKAHRAYADIEKLVEEAERRGALSKWQESADLYVKAFQIAQNNKKRLNESFYNSLELDVKNAKFANLVSLGKKYFISTQWPQAIEKFEAALKLASEDGVADPSISYDVNRYLQRAWFSQYVIDGDQALKAEDFRTASEKFTKAYAIAKDQNLIDEQNRKQVLVKLNQSSLIKLMGDGERFAAEKQWAEAVKSYQKAKKYTMEGYPLIDMELAESQNRVESLLVGAIIGMERQIAARKRAAHQYIAAEAALGRIIKTIDNSPLRRKADFQDIRKQVVAEKNNVHLKAMVDEKILYLQENYRQIVTENFTSVSIKALSNVHIEFLGQEDRALNFKIQCREQRESKYYTLELIYQYDIDLDQWGFPEM